MVYHANYLRYFEMGRASLMRDAAYPYRGIEESASSIPLSISRCNSTSRCVMRSHVDPHPRPASWSGSASVSTTSLRMPRTGVLVCRGHTATAP